MTRQITLSQSLAKKNLLFPALLEANQALQEYPLNSRLQVLVERLKQKLISRGTLKKDTDSFMRSFMRLIKSGSMIEASELGNKAVGLFEDKIEFLHLMGIVEVASENYFNAEKWFLKAHNMDPKNDDVCFNLGNVRLQKFDYGKALDSYTKISCVSEFYKDATQGVVVCLIFLSRFDEAGRIMLSADLSENKICDLLNGHAQSLKKKGGIGCAIETLANARSLFPKNIRFFKYLAALYLADNNAKSSVDVSKAALKIDDNDSHLFNVYGLSLGAIGKLTEAKRAFIKSIQINERNCDAYFNLSQISGSLFDQSQIDWMVQLEKEKSLSAKDRVKIGFAIFNAYDSYDKTDQAWEYLQKANSSKKAELKYDISKDQEFFEKIIITSRQWKHLSCDQTLNSDEFKPIFITGMPRSGTTLIEKICCLNDQVHACGELTYFHDFGNGLAFDTQSPSSETLRNIYNGYKEKIRRKNGTKQIFTDKMPQNFFYIPLIARVFPNVKLICCKRDPLAICWSNYKTMFTDGLGYSFDLDDIKSYYQMFSSLMDRWQKICGEQLHFVDYDDLVQEPQAIIADLSSYLGFELDFACFEQKRYDGEVYSASAYQVRSSIYKGSSRDWERYKKHIYPALCELTS